MTREEAIKQLSEWLNAYCGVKEIEPTTETLNMAIEALKAQIDKDTNVPSNDTISRQAATGIVQFECGEFVGLAKTIIKRFEDLPSAQPEPLKITIDHVPTADELERIKQAMRNTPIMLLPSAQPEITLESAIGYLHSIGWMQEHDRILTKDRDIPKKPGVVTDKAWGIPNRLAVCPNCDSYLGIIHFIGEGAKLKVTYCESCGQAVDWEGWEEDE